MLDRLMYRCDDSRNPLKAFEPGGPVVRPQARGDAERAGFIPTPPENDRATPTRMTVRA
jgi:hypothetical protein